LRDLLSLRLVGAEGARINVRSSYSQWGPADPKFRAQALAVATAAFLTAELSRSPH